MRITAQHAFVSSIVVMGAVVPAIVVAPAAQADTRVTRTLRYACSVDVGFNGSTLPIDPQPTDVGIDFAVADLVRGESLPSTSVDVDLTLSPELHAAVLSLQGRTVTGSSKDTRLEVRHGAASATYPISGLAVADSPIPQDPAQPWVIPITGASPVIEIPDASSVDLLAPQRFTVQSVITGGPFGDVSADLDCKAPTNRLLATVPITGGTDPTSPTPGPTTDPTSVPTSDPTSAPSLAPTNASGGGNGAGTTSSTVDALPDTGAPGSLGLLASIAAALVAGGAALARHRS